MLAPAATLLMVLASLLPSDTRGPSGQGPERDLAPRSPGRPMLAWLFERGTALGDSEERVLIDLSGHGVGEDRVGGLSIVADRAVVQGGLDEVIVRRVVRRRRNDLQYCYEQALAGAPGLSGRLAVRFTIAASGEVTSAVVESRSLDSPGLERCALQAIRRWVFPQPAGGGVVVATYPFTFGPPGQLR